jgi:predicted RNase H-like HicB family nuclease
LYIVNLSIGRRVSACCFSKGDEYRDTPKVQSLIDAEQWILPLEVSRRFNVAGRNPVVLPLNQPADTERAVDCVGFITEAPESPGIRRNAVTYHFRIHDEDGLWAECVELTGCNTQGEDRAELERNMREALNLYLDEPASSTVVFPLPRPELSGPDVVPVEVEPQVASALEARQSGLRSQK